MKYWFIILLLSEAAAETLIAKLVKEKHDIITSSHPITTNSDLRYTECSFKTTIKSNNASDSLLYMRSFLEKYKINYLHIVAIPDANWSSGFGKLFTID